MHILCELFPFKVIISHSMYIYRFWPFCTVYTVARMLPIFYIQWTLFSLSPLNCYNFLKCSTNFTGACGMSCWIFCTYFWVVLHVFFCCLSSGTSICNRQKEQDQLSQEELLIAVFLRDFCSPVFFTRFSLSGFLRDFRSPFFKEIFAILFFFFINWRVGSKPDPVNKLQNLPDYE